MLLLPFTVFAYLRGRGAVGSRVAYGALLTLGLVHTAFTGVLFLAAMRRVRTDRVALFTYAEPVAAVIFAALFLAEPLTVWTVLGGAMVVAAGVARGAPRDSRGSDRGSRAGGGARLRAGSADRPRPGVRSGSG